MRDIADSNRFGWFLFLPQNIEFVRIMVYPHLPVGIPCYDLTPVMVSLFNA